MPGKKLYESVGRGNCTRAISHRARQKAQIGKSIGRDAQLGGYFCLSSGAGSLPLGVVTKASLVMPTRCSIASTWATRP